MLTQIIEAQEWKAEVLIAGNVHFLHKIANGNFFEKNEKFWQFWGKKCQVLGNFLIVKWQFSGGSGSDLDCYI